MGEDDDRHRPMVRTDRQRAAIEADPGHLRDSLPDGRVGRRIDEIGQAGPTDRDRTRRVFRPICNSDLATMTATITSAATAMTRAAMIHGVIARGWVCGVLWRSPDARGTCHVSRLS